MTSGFPTADGGARDRRRSPRRRLALALLALLAASPAGAATAPRLQSLLKSARVALAGHVDGVVEYDDGRVAVLAVAADQVFRGSVPGTPPLVQVVELREGATRASIASGARGLFFLRPAARTSYLAQTLPPGSYDQLLADAGAFVAADSPAELARQRDILGRVLKSLTGPGLDAAAQRQLTVLLLEADNPLLVEDGAAGVADLRAPLSPDEGRALEAALLRSALPERVRLALVRSVADARLTAMVPALQKIDAPPALMEAAWQALDALGAGLSETTLDERLRDPAAATRSAALREKLQRDGVAAIAAVAPLVTRDASPEVRRAGIDALGALKQPEGLPVLEVAFVDNDTELRQAAARAIYSIGGPPAVAALERLATTGPIDSQRYAVVALMLIDDPSKTAIVERLGKTHPDADIRKLITSGPETHH
ncbi:MAG: HEAT repeat domain-containing protein [Deltaproteobacteria bacterium]|nr:HEAT repeat domain-containing protein [Deltaproteobacteria bacterium]